MGIVSPGSPGMYENQFFQTLGKLSEGCISNVPWYDPKAALTKAVDSGVQKAEPERPAAFPRAQRRLHLRSDSDRRRRFQAREDRPTAKPLAEAIRQTEITNTHDDRRADQVQRQGPSRGQPLGVRFRIRDKNRWSCCRRRGRSQASVSLAQSTSGPERSRPFKPQRFHARTSILDHETLNRAFAP